MLSYPVGAMHFTTDIDAHVMLSKFSGSYELITLRRDERLLNNNSFIGEYEYSSLALDRDERRDEKKRLDHLKHDQTMLVIKRFSERKKVLERKKTGKIRAKRRDDFRVEVDVRVLEEEVVPKVDDVSLVDGFFDGAFGGEGEEDVVMGEGVVVTSSSVEMLTNSCLGEFKEDEDDKKSGKDGLFN
ncbi:hypothetical protein Tco_1091321 [Tanacetum coccineum]|uniref:Uncharacterized protein n=1 Tax=Tanacetum coccineum TaxID=301880 RepID=A0ABQ5I6U0_9ASTR